MKVVGFIVQSLILIIAASLNESQIMLKTLTKDKIHRRRRGPAFFVPSPLRFFFFSPSFSFFSRPRISRRAGISVQNNMRK
jgi:hypothetical protein